jgi:hypothetical protein
LKGRTGIFALSHLEGLRDPLVMAVQIVRRLELGRLRLDQSDREGSRWQTKRIRRARATKQPSQRQIRKQSKSGLLLP